MPSKANLTLYGISRLSYVFQVFTLDTEFQNVGAVYAMVRVAYSLLDQTEVLYIGKANELGRRNREHRQAGGQWQPAVNLGMNRICAIAIASEAERDRAEKDLIANYSPRLNNQHNALAQLINALTDPRTAPVNALGAYRSK